MSHQNINPNMQNGIPANWSGTQPPMQKNPNSDLHSMNNGLGSSQSSRDSSPVTRFSNVPASQLPPARATIPTSQLPPARSGVSPIMSSQNLRTVNTSVSDLQTPHSSPRISNFNTSTPISQPDKILKDINSVNSESGDSVQQNNHSVTQSSVTRPDYTTNSHLNNYNNSAGQQNLVNLRSNQNAADDIRSNFPPTGPPAQNSLSHAFSTPTLTQSQQNVPTIRQNLNQPPTIQRPSSSGPQLQQTSDQKSQGPQTTNQPIETNQPQNQSTNVSQSFNSFPQMTPAVSEFINSSSHNVRPPIMATNSLSNTPSRLPMAEQNYSTPQLVSNVVRPPIMATNLPSNVSQRPSLPEQNYSAPPSVSNSESTSAVSESMNLPGHNIVRPPIMATNSSSNFLQRPPMQAQNYSAFPSVSNSELSRMQTTNMNLPGHNVVRLPVMTTNSPQRPSMPAQNYSAPPPVSNSEPNRMQASNMNLPGQNIVRPPIMATNSPQRPPMQTQNYSAPSQVSNLHSKRYPQPQTQFQNQPNSNFPSPNTNTQSINTYNQQQQQQGNMYIQQQNLTPQSQQNFAPQTQQSNIYYQQQQPQQINYQQQQQQQNQMPMRNYQQNLSQQMQNLNVVKGGFNKIWGHENYDLLQCPNVLPEESVEAPKVCLGQEFLDAANCSSEIFRCTMTKIPESNSLLQKSRLPLGVLIHPFKDLNHLPVIQCSTIVRCRACRTYINPFIFFVDSKRWKCNLCYRVNELPEEFQYDPVSKTYGDPSRRPEIKSSTIEYIAPSEYMLRPPQPAVYLFLLDISRNAIESGYLHTICEVLASQLSSLPGDARTQIGFLAYNSTLHFFSLAEGLNQPHEMIVSDVDDVFIPCPDNLLVNLKEHMELVSELLSQLPTRYQNSYDNGSALGAALQAAFKLMSSTGGRVTVFQTNLPMIGPGALTVREDPNQRAGKEAPHLNPATDFYKRLALDCSGHQIAVDLFIMNSQYVDIATLSGISRFSGGCMYHFPLFKANKQVQVESLERSFKRYLTRKIGFEAVMRIRCTRGLSIHTFHGNFFVRSTDLLSLPNVNPDAGFGMQVSIEESLSDLQSVCFQAALLYTSSKGERRIRVHTLCLPVVTTLAEVLNSADQQCIVGVLAKMAVDRSLQSSLSDARDAFINVAIDILSSYKLSLNMGNASSGLMAPQSLKLLPLYILALLKYTAFRTGQSTRLDDRVFAMCDMKSLPLVQLLQNVYPDMYPIYRLAECQNIIDPEGITIPQPRRLQLTSRNIDSHGAYLLEVGQQMLIFVCQNVSQAFLSHTLGVPNYSSITDQCYELPKLDNPDNQRLHAFINSLNDEKPYPASLHIMRENSPNRTLFLERLIEDRIEFALSYNEFLQHIKTQVK